MQLLYPDPTGIGTVGFSGGRKPEVPGEKPLKQGENHQQTQPTYIIWHQDRIETRPHCLWWEAGALTTVPPLLTKEGFCGVHSIYIFALSWFTALFVHVYCDWLMLNLGFG